MSTTALDRPRGVLSVADYEKANWFALTIKQKDACPRVGVGYTDNGHKQATRSFPRTEGWQGKVINEMARLTDDGKTGIWTTEQKED